MTLNQIKQAAEIARTRTTAKRWLAAIDKAVAGVVSGWWIVTELHNCLAITTETGNTYFANGVCQCEAYRQSQACKHRALYRLYAIAQEIEETATPAVSEPAATKAATSDARYCGDRDLQHLDRCKPHVSLEADVEASSRKNLIAEIENIWPRFAPGLPLATELMARFRVNRLDMLADDMLKAVRLAVAL